MADEYGYGRDPKTGRLNWRFRTLGDSPFNMLIEKGRDKLGLRSVYNVGGLGGRDDPKSERNIKKSQKLQEVNKKIQVLEQKKASLKSEMTKVANYQTKGKKTLLTNQPVKSKGGGKSAGGGGGKYGIINRALGGRSPWHHLKRLLE